MRRHSLAGGLLLGVLAWCGSAHAGGPSSRQYAPDTEGIFWFLHVSDLHFDTGASTPGKNLEYVLGPATQVFQPAMVFASGDLVNGTVMGIPTSGQDQAEWDLYEQSVAKMNVSPAFYFDMPGNHDGYGDDGLTHFLSSSVQGKATGTLFSDATFTTPLGEYYFAAMNSSGTYDKPFTYGQAEFTNVEDLVAGLDAHKSAQLVFVFAHHHLVPHGACDAQTQLGVGGPDNPPSNEGEVIPLLEQSGAFYLHGHVHQFKESMQGNVPTYQIGRLGSEPKVDRSSVDAYDQTKFQSNIGVGIVDHNAFIYRTTDTTDPWPFVAITAPVDVNLQGGGWPAGTETGVDYPGDYLDYGAQKNPWAYDVCGPNKANPVRALVLSDKPVTKVSVTLDDAGLGELKAATDPKGIYATTIDTSTVKVGLHWLSVTAEAGGLVRTDSIQVNITEGPCAPMGDAGVDAEPEAGQDAAKEASAEAAVEAAAGQDAGEDAEATPPDESASDGGCGCSVPGGSRTAGLGWVVAIAGLLTRRRRKAGPSAPKNSPRP